MTLSVCPSRFYNYFPVFLSQIFIVLSHEADTISVSSFEKLTFVTYSECPFKFYNYLPVVLSQIFTDKSQELDTIFFPLGEKLTDVT